jgi:hypothetical protein
MVLCGRYLLGHSNRLPSTCRSRGSSKRQSPQHAARVCARPRGVLCDRHSCCIEGMGVCTALPRSQADSAGRHTHAPQTGGTSRSPRRPCPAATPLLLLSGRHAAVLAAAAAGAAGAAWPPQPWCLHTGAVTAVLGWQLHWGASACSANNCRHALLSVVVRRAVCCCPCSAAAAATAVELQCAACACNTATVPWAAVVLASASTDRCRQMKVSWAGGVLCWCSRVHARATEHPLQSHVPRPHWTPQRHAICRSTFCKV